MYIRLSLFIISLFTTAALNAQQLELVSSSKYYSGNFLPMLSLQDSTNYIHSNGRNSDGYKNTWLYDSCEKYVPGQPGYVGDIHQRWTQSFSTNGSVIKRKFYRYTNTAVEYRGQREFIYTNIGGKTLLSEERQYGMTYDYGGITDSFFKYYHYNNDGRYTHSASGTLDGLGNFEMYSTDSTWYDANNNIMRTAFWQWDGPPINKWVKRGGGSFVYDNANRLLVDTPYYVAPYKAYTTYAYNAKGMLAETQRYSTDDTGAWFKGTRELYTYDKHDNLIKIDGMGKEPQSISYYSFYEMWFQYNGFNQLTQKLYVLHPPGAPRNDSSLERYYYGKYLPLTITSPESNIALSIYPSPAVSNITVEATLKTADAITAYITDMNGRIVKQWQDAGTRQYRKQINVMDLPAGTYSLTVSAGSEKQQKTFVVVR